MPNVQFSVPLALYRQLMDDGEHIGLSPNIYAKWLMSAAIESDTIDVHDISLLKAATTKANNAKRKVPRIG